MNEVSRANDGPSGHRRRDHAGHAGIAAAVLGDDFRAHHQHGHEFAAENFVVRRERTAGGEIGGRLRVSFMNAFETLSFGCRPILLPLPLDVANPQRPRLVFCP